MTAWYHRFDRRDVHNVVAAMTMGTIAALIGDDELAPDVALTLASEELAAMGYTVFNVATNQVDRRPGWFLQGPLSQFIADLTWEVSNTVLPRASLPTVPYYEF